MRGHPSAPPALEACHQQRQEEEWGLGVPTEGSSGHRLHSWTVGPLAGSFLLPGALFLSWENARGDKGPNRELWRPKPAHPPSLT